MIENSLSPFGSIRDTGSLTLIRCQFINNAAGLNGDVYSTGTLWVESCRFIDTSSPRPGIRESHSVITGNGPTTVVNSLFHNCANPSSAVLSFPSTTSPEFRTVVNCTFPGNSVRTIVETWGLAAVNVRNTIVWGNTHSQPAFTGAAVVQYSNIQGGWSGTGNINVNPIFKAADQGDYRLSAGSPCIDRADASALPPGITLDLAGKPRFFGDPLTSNVNAAGTPPYLDMGAYEYQGPFVCLPDLTTTANPFLPGFGVPDGVLNSEDFFYYLLLYANNNFAADLTTTAIPGTPGYGIPNGVINSDDFFYYLVLYAAGCDD